MQASIFREKRFWLSSLFAILIFGLALPSVIAQEGENLCRTAITQTIEVGETLAGSIISDIPYAFFCFEGERGDNVNITVEVTDGRLIPVVFITDAVFNEADLENPLGAGQANREGGSAEANFEIDSSDTYLIVVFGLENTLGTFNITLEAEGRSIFDTPTEEPDTQVTDEANPDETEEPDDNGDNGSSSGGVDLNEIEFGSTNICRVDGVEELEYGDSATGELTIDEQPITFFCFEGQAGDVIHIEGGTSNGDIVLQLAIADIFFDLESAFAVGFGEERDDSIGVDFEVPEDGDYLIVVGILDGEEGEFYLELTGEAGVAIDCTSEPLSILTSQEWVIAPVDGEASLVSINLACDGQIAVAAMGAYEIGYYDLDQEGNLSFVFGNNVFTTVSLDETGWTIANQGGTEYTLVPLEGTSCSDGLVSSLINGSWELDRDQAAYLSFTCNGVLILNVQGQAVAHNYSLEEDTITISLGTNVLELEDVVIDGSELSATIDGDEIEIENVLAD